MAIKSTYTQGETIQPSLTDASALSVVFRYFPSSDESARNAARTLLSSLKSSTSMGELHVTDKTAAEIDALSAIINHGNVATDSGSVTLSMGDDNEWTGTLDSSAMFGTYSYVILRTDASYITTAASGGTFTVTGDPSAATCGGGPFNIHTRFC